MTRDTLASIKRRLTAAKDQLKSEGRPVYMACLSRDAKISEHRLYDLLTFTVPQWRVELEIVRNNGWASTDWNKQLVFNLYEFAAGLARNNNEMPTATNLSEMLHMNRQVVLRFMRRFPEFAKKINFCTECECEIYKAGRLLRLRAKEVTMHSIARETGRSYNWVREIMRRRPEFARLIALDKYHMSAEQKKRIGNARRERAKSPQQPLWVKDTVELPDLTRNPDATIAAKILATVALRHAVQPHEFFKKHAASSKLSVLQNLVGYLLIEDAGLSAAQVGDALGNRTKKQVNDGRRMILRNLRLECAQAELAVLRRIYLP